MLVGLDFMIGGVVCALPVWLVSRLAIWGSRNWVGDADRLVLSHGVTWIVCGLIATTMMPFLGDDYAVRASLILVFPQLCLLVIDMARLQAQRLQHATAAARAFRV